MPTSQGGDSAGMPAGDLPILKAALEAVQLFNGRSDSPIHKMLVPGLCTGIGRMDPFVSAKQMSTAFDEVFGNRNACTAVLQTSAAKECYETIYLES